jgi:branched-subunit amino acid ABC-type transport system permease component
MAFFLETLIGGLMAGMLYSLVALGFVLIYKASGVFNFAQGAMVLFAALAMARFSEWIPKWTGIDNLFIANLIAFAIAAVLMFVVAWLIERLVLRHLVNQGGIPTIVFGPGTIAEAHRPDERIPLAGYLTAIEHLIEIIVAWCDGDRAPDHPGAEDPS